MSFGGSWLVRRGDGARAALLLLVLTALTFALYGRAVTWTFVADDLTNLRFVRSYDGSAWDFWIPGRAFGAPVTQSRYMPLHVAHWWLADRLFGDATWAWHASSFALHAVVATLVGLLARASFGVGWRAAALISAAFVACRAHAQAVVWISVQFRLLATALLIGSLLVALAPTARSKLPPLTLCAAGLLLNPDLVVAPVVFAAFAWAVARAGERERARHLATIAAWALLLVAGYAVANAVTNARHPDTFALSPVPRPDRLAVFLANLVVPFDLPFVAKLIACAAAAALLARFRELATAPLVLAALASALLWSAATSYDVAPRYLYLPATFATVALAGALVRARPAVATVLVAAWTVANARAVLAEDLPRFAYLPILPQRLAELSATAPGARVLITPDAPLPDADLAFFDRLTFVSESKRATAVVDTGIDPFRARYGAGFAARYWELPWLTTAP